MCWDCGGTQNTPIFVTDLGPFSKERSCFRCNETHTFLVKNTGIDSPKHETNCRSAGKYQYFAHMLQCLILKKHQNARPIFGPYGCFCSGFMHQTTDRTECWHCQASTRGQKSGTCKTFPGSICPLTTVSICFYSHSIKTFRHFSFKFHTSYCTLPDLSTLRETAHARPW